MQPKKSWHIARREFLRGTGGIALGLPLFNAMSWAGEATAVATLPKRVACFFFPNGVSLPPASDSASEDWHWFPKGAGKDFVLNKSTASFEKHRSDITFLAGLSHPNGRHMAGHGVSDIYLTAGPVDPNAYSNTISMDQIVADKIGEDTRLKSLALSCGGGVGTAGRTHTLSFTKNGQPIPAEDNIRRCFNLMFSSDGSNLKEAKKALLLKKSMLDRVLEDSKSLKRRLNAEDQRKLDEYLTSMRNYEKRIERMERWLNTPKALVDGDSVNLDATANTMEDYVRATYDLLFHAFQTDTTRVATHMLGIEGGGSKTDNFPEALGLKPHHALSHRKGSSFEDWGVWDQFMNQNFAYFLDRLKGAQEGEGSVLDRTIIMYGCSTSTTHLAKNYPLILAGGSKLGIKHGQFRKFDENKARLADLFVSMINALDVPTEKFGDSTGDLGEIFTA
ncbi:MAG: hypothetical protein ACI9G1_005557 [Pirellulaceae bacterium]|jgi:hypothetical protein